MAFSSSSSIAEIIENDFLNCRVCFERYQNPKYLPCHHTYCEGCVRKLASGPTNAFQCPECRVRVTLSEGGVGDLKTNFYVNSLLNVLQSNEKDGKMCSLCPLKGQQNAPAITQCLDCPSFMCQLCTSDHLSTPSQRHHRVLRLSDSSCEAELRVSKKIYCLGHPKEEGSYFCRPCNASVCNLCLVRSHSHHGATEMSRAALSRTPAMWELVGKFNAKVQSLARSQGDLNASLEKLKATERSIEAKMEAAVAEVQSALFKQRDDIRKKMSDFVKQQETLYETAKADLQNQVTSAESTREYAERVLRAGQNSSIVCLEEVLGDQLKSLLTYQPPSVKEDIPTLEVNKATKDCMSQMDLFRIEFGQQAPTQKAPPGASQQPPPAKPPKQARRRPGNSDQDASFAFDKLLKALGSCESSQPPVPGRQLPPAKTHKRARKVWPKPTLRCHFKTDLNRDSYAPRLTGVSTLRKGDIIVADEANGILKRYSIDGDFRAWFSVVDADNDPCSVTVCGDLIVYSSEAQLYIVELNGDLVKQLLLKGSESSYPITSYRDEYIVVSEGSLCSLSLYNLDGQVVDRVKPRGYQGTRFLFVAVSSKENFIVSDIGQKRLVIFTKAGEVLSVCNDIVVQGVSRSLNPFGVCVDRYDNIYVSQPSSIASFSPTGVFKREILASNDGINKPRAITVAEDDNLIVTQTDGEVYVFKLFLG